MADGVGRPVAVVNAMTISAPPPGAVFEDVYDVAGGRRILFVRQPANGALVEIGSIRDVQLTTLGPGFTVEVDWGAVRRAHAELWCLP